MRFHGPAKLFKFDPKTLSHRLLRSVLASDQCGLCANGPFGQDLKKKEAEPCFALPAITVVGLAFHPTVALPGRGP